MKLVFGLPRSETSTGNTLRSSPTHSGITQRKENEHGSITRKADKFVTIAPAKMPVSKYRIV